MHQGECHGPGQMTAIQFAYDKPTPATSSSAQGCTTSRAARPTTCPKGYVATHGLREDLTGAEITTVACWLVNGDHSWIVESVVLHSRPPLTHTWWPEAFAYRTDPEYAVAIPAAALNTLQKGMALHSSVGQVCPAPVIHQNSH